MAASSARLSPSLSHRELNGQCRDDRFWWEGEPQWPHGFVSGAGSMVAAHAAWTAVTIVEVVVCRVKGLVDVCGNRCECHTVASCLRRCTWWAATTRARCAQGTALARRCAMCCLSSRCQSAE